MNLPDANTLNLQSYYLLDESLIVQNLQKVQRLCALSGAKALLALKCFASHAVFDAMRPYLAGTTSSSLYELRLGYETFGGETHAYSVAWRTDEIDEALGYADKIIFNSKNQLDLFADKAHKQGIPVGLRLNPKVSNSSFSIADPAREFSRLGEYDIGVFESVLDKISGVMIHYNCENDDFNAFCASLDDISKRFGGILAHLEWVSLGGGIHFIGDDYPLDKLAQTLKDFATRFGVQVYLEPGEACIHGAGVLVAPVIDTLYNGKALAVVDASIEAHMLDLLIYRQSAPLAFALRDGKALVGDTSTLIYGRSCLAGDIFGEYNLPALQVGDVLGFGNAAGYTLVKKNWFNGINMPAIVLKKLDGSFVVQKRFDYLDYKNSLS